jgi:serine/threonine protein kinase
MTDKRRFTCRADDEAAIREISMLTALQEFQCRHLPRVIHVTEDENRYFLVMDYVQGGNLSMMIQIQHHFSELHVQAIGRSLLFAVAEMHRLSLGHFSLSPENILLRAGTTTNEVVLCDFGCALDLRFSRGTGSGTNSVSNPVGSSPRYGALCYAAPELLGNDQEYGLAADLWSVGVILYELLCGRLPFEDVSKRALKDKISAGKFKFTGSEWHIVSRSAKQFISSLLHPDPQVRLTVGEALGHPWIVLRRYGDESPGSPKKTKLRNQLKRLFGRSRDVEKEQLEHEPVDSSQRITNPPKLPELSTESTLTDSDSFGAGSSISLPRPLEYYRRPRLVGM